MYDQVIPYIIIGVGADITVIDDISSITGNNAILSNTAELTDAYYLIDDTMASYEADGIPTALSRGMLAPPISSVSPPPYKGVWSNDITSADGSISWTLTVTLARPHSTALSLYFADMDVIGTVVLSQGGTQVASIPMSTVSWIFISETVYSYDTMVITVTHGDKAYTHVKLAEIEFGASRTLPPTDFCDTINVIQEVDLLQSSVPLYELDFSLINVDGKYDIDNVNEFGVNENLELIAIGTAVTVAFTLIEEGVRSSYLMGRYLITRHNSEDESFQVTAQDYRTVLQNKIYPLTLSTAMEISGSIGAMLSNFHVSYVIDAGARGKYPTYDYTFGNDVTALDQLLYIQQMYQIYVLPETDGMLHISYGEPSGTLTSLTQSLMISYPKQSHTVMYNLIAIEYGPSGSRQTYEHDLRTDPSEVVGSFTIDNPLIQTEAEAEALALRIEGKMSQQLYTAEAIGFPDFKVGRTVGIEGRFSAGSPLDYKLQMLEFEYDGGLTMRLEGIR